MCKMLQHLILLHMIFACMESNHSPVCIQMMHHRANEVDGIIYGEDRAMAISASMVPQKAEDDVDMLSTVVLPDDGRFIDILGKRLSSNAASHHGFFLVLLCFPKTFDWWTFEACLPSCSNGCFWRLFQQLARLWFLHFLRNVHSQWSVRKLEEGSTGEDVFFRMSTFDYLQLAKDVAFANGTWGCKTSKVPLGLWHLLVHKASWNAWKARSTLETSKMHPSFTIKKHQSQIWNGHTDTLLVDFLHDFMHLSLVEAHLFLVNSCSFYCEQSRIEIGASPNRGARFLGPSFSAIQNSLAVWPPRARCQGGEWKL